MTVETSPWRLRSAAGLCLAAWWAAPAFAQTAAEMSEIREQIARLRAEQARVAGLQQQIDTSLKALESRLSTDAANSAVASPGASGGSGQAAAPVVATTTPAPIAPVSARPRLEVNGDFRLRGQGDYSDEDGKDRNSSQIRGRLGGTYTVNDRVSLGARLVTGDADDPNSTDVQLSNFDDDLQVSLDLAYVQLNFDNLKVYGGKLPQPFTRTDLVWDGDVNPQGASAVYKRPLGGGSFRANSLFFIVDEQAAGPESTMLGGQLGYDSPALGKWKYDVSAAYYDYRLGSTAGGDAGDFRSNLRNPDGSYLSDFNLADVIAGATWAGASDRWPVRILGDYVKNLGAETSADTGYSVDFTLGRASKAGDWRVTYGYSVAETDSVFAAFSHDNLGIATNYKLHTFALDYVPRPKTTISAIWYHYKPYQALDAGSNAPGDWLERVRLYFLVNL